MKRTINEYDFISAFDDMGRGDNFSYGGRTVLFDILTEYENDCDVELELDVVAICCQFSEYTINELAADYDFISQAIGEAMQDIDADELDADEKRICVESAFESVGAMYYWINDDALILDVESF